MKSYVTVPNALTSIRIIGAFCLLLAAPLSMAFYAVYIIAGLSDAADGFVARRMGKTSAFGAKLDSVADLTFYSVTVIRLLPALTERLNGSLWGLISAVLIIRLASYITAAVKFHTLASLHTYLNKLTGFLLFVFPFLIGLGWFRIYVVICCFVGASASLEEWLIHLHQNRYDPNCRTLLFSYKKGNRLPLGSMIKRR